MNDTEPTDEIMPTGAAPQAAFEHLSRRRVQSVLNCLTEATFFYREDDRDLFDYLRRHRAEFERFLGDWFGWELHVDRKCARLFKRHQSNSALTPKQRYLFDLTKRDECILFMLLLEFHEMQLAAQNVHYEHDEDLNFVLADFVTHAVSAYRKRLGDSAPSDRELFLAIQSLFRELERHRFLRLQERGPEDGAAGDPARHLLYTVLPGLHCYDPSRLNEAVFRRSFGLGEDPEAEAAAQEQTEQEEAD